MIRPKKYSDRTPHIVGFICNWGAYSGLEMAGMEKRQYPASVRLVRLMCLGRLHLGLVLKAFELGADGVMLLGCPAGECHYEAGTESAKELLVQARKVLHLLGIDPERLDLIEVPLGRGDLLARRVTAFTKRIGQAGASPLRSRTKRRLYLKKGLH